MKLLVIRHAIAEDASDSARPKADAQRQLTQPGQKRMRRGAKALAKILPKIDRLVTSPLTRAVQTGKIVAAAYGDLQTVQIAALSPGKPPAALLQWLQQQSPAATLAVVGHEPHLGIFVSWMLTGLQESFVSIKKGGACLLELDGEIRAGRAKLLWLLKPPQLRNLRR